ncbi:MAG: hypothetical protein FWG61_05900 [Firmicutes bacterium]|nr:hypothetical protein [Bacillota bacterium]
MLKKILTILLAAIMLLTIIPMTALSSYQSMPIDNTMYKTNINDYIYNKLIEYGAVDFIEHKCIYDMQINTLNLLDEEQLALIDSHNIICFLPGKYYKTDQDDFIMLSTCSNSQDTPQDNGVLGILGVLKYFSQIPQSQRLRTIIINIDGYYLEESNNSLWLHEEDIFNIYAELESTVLDQIAYDYINQHEILEQNSIDFIYNWIINQIQNLTTDDLTTDDDIADDITADGLTADGLTADSLTADSLIADDTTVDDTTTDGITTDNIVYENQIDFNNTTWVESINLSFVDTEFLDSFDVNSENVRNDSSSIMLEIPFILPQDDIFTANEKLIQIYNGISEVNDININEINNVYINGNAYITQTSMKTTNKYDVNNDGNIDQLDITTILLNYGGDESDDNWETIVNNDVNEDGRIDIEDIILSFNHILWE